MFKFLKRVFSFLVGAEKKAREVAGDQIVDSLEQKAKNEAVNAVRKVVK